MTPQLVGRDAELEDLLRLARATAAGVGGVALVEGEGGIGKTALVDALVDRVAGELGGRVRRGRAWEEGGAPPYWPWPEVVAATGAAPARSGASDPFVVGAELVDALRAVAAAADGPLLVVLDDLHAAGDEALRLTRFVARSAAALPLLLVVAARPSPHVRPLGREGLHLVLGRLSREDAHAVVRAAVEGLDAALVEEVCRRAEGLPLFLRELARGARSGRVLPRDLPTVVQPTIDALDADARELLELAAVLGRSCAVDRLAAVAGVAPGTCLEVLDRLGATGVVEIAGVPPVVTFSHQLVRDVVYEQLPAGRRLALHARAAPVIDEVAESARHLLAAVPVVAADEAVAALRRAAATARARGAHADAAALRHDALALVTGADRLDVLTERGTDLAACGRVRDAAVALDEAIDAARRAGDVGRLAAAVLARTERVAWGLGAVAMVPVLDDAIARVDAARPRSSWRATAARLRARRASLLATGTDPAVAVAAARDALATARALDPPDDVVLVDALAAMHRCCWTPDRLPDALALSAELVEVAARVDDADRLSEALLARLIDHLRSGDLPGVDRALDRYAAFAAATGRPRDEYFLLSRRAMRRFLAGDLAAGDHLAGLAHELGLRIEEPDTMQVFYGARMIVVADLQDASETRIAAEQAVSIGRDEPRVFTYAAHSFLRAGDPGAAADALDRLRAAMGPLDVRALPVFDLCLIAEVAAGVNRPGIADEARRALEPLAGELVVNAGAVTFGGVVDDYLAMLAVARGDRDAALRHARAASAAYHALGASWFAARIDGRIDALAAPARAAPAAVASTRTFVLRPRGELWEIGRPGATTLLRDARGLQHLHAILRADGRAVAAAELVGGAEARELVSREAHHALLDDRAKAAYRRRIRDLREEVDDADAAADLERAARARVELDVLVDELTRAVGLGGRDRFAGAQSERARVAVRKAIAATTERVARHDPQLAHVLRATVRTGAWCSYEPDPVSPVVWELS